MTRIPKSLRLLGGLAFTAVALWFMWRAFRSGQARIEDFSVPSTRLLLLSGLAVAVALALWTWIWGRLLGVRLSRIAVRDFLLGLLGKYIPGGIWTPGAHMVAGARQGSSRRALVSVVRQAGSGVLGAAAWLAPVALASDWPAVAKLGVVVTTALAWWLWLRFDVVGWGVRLVTRSVDTRESPLPWREGLVILIAAAATFYLHGIGFGLLLGGDGSLLGGDGLLVAAGAYAVAWAVGYVAVPFPAGLGVREAVLIALLADQHTTSLVVATSVIFRLVTLVTEGVLVAALALSGRWRQQGSASVR